MQSLFFYIWRVNWRWYFTGIIIVLAFFGMSMGQSTTNPNQEIVVRFNASSINSDEVQLAISDIRNQLKSIGIENVHVSEILNGQLKVTYFSDKDVAVVKKLFLQQNKLDFSDTAFHKNEGSGKLPFGDHSNSYKLDVIKIQQDLGSDLGFQGTLIEIKSANAQYLKPILSSVHADIYFSLKAFVNKAGSKSFPDIAFSVNNSPHKIPEVRAGPLSS